MISIDNLRQYSLFGGITDDMLEYIISLMQRREINSGEKIVEQSGPGGEVYFILEGEVQVVIDGVEVSTLKAGEQFGEMHMIDIEPRSATAIAKGPVVVFILKQIDMFRIRNKCQESFIMLLMNCSRDISRRLRTMNDKYVRLQDGLSEKDT